MPQQITDATTDNIIRGLEKMCDLTESGLNPTDAAIKVAKDRGYTRGQIDLLCQGYNAGAINTQRREGETFAEKFSAVAQADSDKVAAAIFPDKPAPAVKTSSQVASVYLPGSAKKVAKAFQPKEPPKRAPVPEDITPYRQAKNKLAELQDLRIKCGRAELNAHGKVAAVADAIRLSYKQPENHLGWLRKAANSYFGPAGRQVIEKVAKDFLTAHSYQKLCSENRELIPDQQREPIELRSGALAAVKEAVDAITEWATLEASLPMRAIEIRRDIHNTYGGGAEKAAQQISLPGKSKEESAAIRWEKKASMLTGLAGGLMARTANGVGGGDAKPNPGPPIEGARLKLNDPSHDAELRAIRAEAMLSDLINNDEVISSYSPEEVASEFMEISQSAPSAIDNMALLRANLRRNLQGNLTTFEAKELAGLRDQKVNDLYNVPSKTKGSEG